MLKLFVHRRRMWVVTCLLSMAGFVIGGGGCGVALGEQPPENQQKNKPQLSGKYRSSNSEKTFVFEKDRYKLYFTQKDLKEDRPTLDAEYSVFNRQITFYQADTDEPFAQEGQLTSEFVSFTWNKYPGETFKKTK